MPPAGISLRAQSDADLDFLADLYAETREEELKPVDWPDDVKRAFLRSQFDAQWAHYSLHYFDAAFQVVERAGERIGRFYVWHDERDVRIVDIALIAAARGSGIGTALLREVMADAEREAKTVSIHVYERLGFQHIDEHGVYYLMKWTPPPNDQPNTA
jgi:GNAT superfamily N-acetyltransferase